MKTTRILGVIAAAAVFLFGLTEVQAQGYQGKGKGGGAAGGSAGGGGYRGGAGGAAGGGAGGGGGYRGGAGTGQKANPAQPKFKDLPLNTQFFFLSDTNRAYPWTKITATTARNEKNSNVVAVASEMLIAR